MKRIALVGMIALFMLGIMAGCVQEGEKLPLKDSSMEEPSQDIAQTPDTTENDRNFPETTGRIPLIYSHDGAPDDIATLVYISKHPDIDLLGVIQSYGEQHPGWSLEAWQVFLYDIIDDDEARMGVGSEESLDPEHNEFPSGWRQGADDFWGLELPPASQVYQAENGADLIIDLVKNSEEKVTILVTGAQTDMALAIQKEAGIAENISQIVIMGGAFNVDGNLYDGYNTVAEWNIYADPLAAKIVFNSGIPLSIVSLDGSDNFVISPQDHEKIAGSTDPTLALLSDLWEFNFRSWGGDFKIWDIVAAAALTDAELYTWTYDGVDVDAEAGATHGQTFALNNGSPATRFTAGTDYEGVRAAIFNVLK